MPNDGHACDNVVPQLQINAMFIFSDNYAAAQGTSGHFPDDSWRLLGTRGF